MADCKFTPCATLPKFKGKPGLPKISFYPAKSWEDTHGGKPGMWRIMHGSKWHTRPNESASFFTLEGVTKIVMDHLSQGLGLPVDSPGVTPGILPKTPVRYWPHDQTQPLDSFTKNIPFTDQHGEQRVWIFYKNNPVLLADLELRNDPRNPNQQD
ncbi:MAG: hypothetical protein JEY79_01150 [Pseudodesulfovibrio sp.]|nr:hypothetical protein [Pseudodesulfovibrio sp.]